jgi:predicted RNase H-like HicB family nuclease
MLHYIGLIHKEASSDYGVSFPDLPGCISAGSTLDEARAMAAEALALHLEGMAEDGVEPPAPSSLEEIMADAENRDGVAILVDAPARMAPVRINVTLPADVLAAIDTHTQAQGLTRSGFLARAALSAIGKPAPKAAQRRPRRAAK